MSIKKIFMGGLKRLLGPKIWRQLKIAFGREVRAKVDRIVKLERFGSAYGGWDFATEFVDEASVVYSFGVGADVTFDVLLMERYGLTIHAFDPTPKSINWVKSQNLPEGFIMHEYGVADVDGEVTFSPPENGDQISHTILDRPSKTERSITVQVKRIETIMRELGHDRIDLLKMDIEGAEYSVVDDLLRTAVRPEQILVEFHHRFENVGLDKTRAAVEALKRAGYNIVHITVTGEEYSFLRA